MQNKTEVRFSLAGVMIRTNENKLSVYCASKPSDLVKGCFLKIPLNGTQWMLHAGYTNLIVGNNIITNMLKQTLISISSSSRTQYFIPPKPPSKPVS